MAKESQKPVVLSHFISQEGGQNKTLQQEVVKPGSASARFLRKIELNRLSLPCLKVIDKRKDTTEHCYPYEHQKIIHYMDEASIELFENLIHQNNGSYTEYIYQAVTRGQNFLEQEVNEIPENENTNKKIPSESDTENQVIKESEPSDIELYEKYPAVEIVPFGYHLHQHEVRMNYISSVFVYTRSSHQGLHAKTIDISISGTRIKSEMKLPVDIQDNVEIVFEGLVNKGIIASSKIEYRIIDFYQEQQEFIYRLQRHYQNADDEIAHALYQFITTHKRRYKIDLEDFKSMILSNVYERLYAESLHNLPLFFSAEKDQIKLSYILTNQHYQLEQYVPSDFNGTLADYLYFLTQKLPLKKITQLLQNDLSHQYYSTSKIIHIYSWMDSDAIYVGFDSGKEKSKPFLYMINQGLDKPSFRIWELKIRPVTLPNIDQSLNIDSLSNEEAESILQETEVLSFMAIFSPVIFDSDEMDSIKNQYEMVDTQFPHRLNDFKVNTQLGHNIEIIKVADKINRSENRYQLNTGVEIKSSQQVITGKTIDFSPNGVKVKLDKPLKSDIRDEIDISFSSLQKKYPKEHLTNQHYRLTHLSGDKKVACFNRDHRFILHEASLFFRKVIEFNQNKLSACSSDQKMMIRSGLFEKILTTNLCSMPILLSHKNQATILDAIAHDENPSSIMEYLKLDNQLQWQWLLNKNTWDVIESKISRLKSALKSNHQYSIAMLLLLQKNKNHDIELVQIIDEYELILEPQHAIFDHLSLHHDLLLKLTLTPSINFPEKEYVDEINEVRLNSKIDAVKLKKRLQSIRYIAELTDKTEFYCRKKVFQHRH